MRSAIIHSLQLLSLFIVGSVAGAQQPLVHGKIIEWGWSTPSPLYVQKHVVEMEKIPFDGIVMELCGNDHHDLSLRPDRQASFPSLGWSATPLIAKNFSQSIDALKQTHFVRFTDNFLRFNTTPGNVDWFDPKFSGVVANIGLLARIARQTGMKGIMLDTEAYDRQLFNYSRLAGKGEHTFAEYQTQARLRGREMMSAISREYPDCRVIVTLAYGLPHGLEGNEPLPSHKYGLLPSMLDGMIEGCGDHAMLFDGWEYSYNDRTKKQFDAALDTIKRKSLSWSAVPELMKKRWHASFGIWLDYGHKWDPRDFGKNFFTPAEFAWSVHQGLLHTDAYVWIWSEVPSWWNGKMPAAYVEALNEARKPNLQPPAKRKSPF